MRVSVSSSPTDMRAASADAYTKIDASVSFSLDECLEYIGSDEVAEVTPGSVRMAKIPKEKRQRR